MDFMNAMSAIRIKLPNLEGISAIRIELGNMLRIKFSKNFDVLDMIFSGVLMPVLLRECLVCLWHL